jgi:hypothetical protein
MFTHSGNISLLTGINYFEDVTYFVEVGVEDQSGVTDFLQPSLRDRPSLFYPYLVFGADMLTLSWLYSPDPMSPCATAIY